MSRRGARWLLILLAIPALGLLLPIRAAPAADEKEAAPPTADELKAEGVKAFQRALGLREQGEHAKALVAFDEARRYFEAATLPDLAALMVGWMAESLSTLGLHEKALDLRQEGLRRLIEIHGETDHPAVATSLFLLAEALTRVGRNASAIERYEAALAMRRRLHSGDHPEVAESHSRYARCLESLGRAGEALPNHEAALAMRQRLVEGDHLLIATGLNNVATCLESLGRAGEALPEHEGALAMFRRLNAGDHHLTATSLGNLAGCLDSLGRSTEALPKYEAALAMFRRILPADHELIARALNNLAYGLERSGRAAEALAEFEDALAMLDRLGASDLKATTLSNLASCLDSLGRPEEALPLYEQALAIFRGNHAGPHPLVVQGLGNLAYGLQRLGRAADALPRLEEALAMVRRLVKGDHPDLALALNNLAGCRRSLDRAVDARPDFEEALAIRRRLFPGDHPDVVVSLTNLASCLAALELGKTARPLLEEAVAISRRLRSPGTHARAALLASLLLREKDETDRAIELYAEAIAQIEELRRGATGLEGQDRATYFGHLKRSGAFEGMVRAQIRAGRPTEALRYLEKGRARSLLDLLEQSRFDPLAEVERRAREQGATELLAEIRGSADALAEGEREIRRIAHAEAAVRGRTDLLAVEQSRQLDVLAAAMVRARELRTAGLRRRARIIRDKLEVAGAEDPGAIQRLLAGNQRMLLYSLGDEDGLLLVVPPPGEEIRAYALSWPDGSPVTWSSARDAADAHVRGIIRARGKGRNDRGWETEDEDAGPAPGSAEAGHRLFRALVPEKVWAEIAGADRIALVPHGALHRLPFEALVVDPEKRVYWLDRGPAIAYGSSGSVLLWSHRRRDDQAAGRRPDGLVALGDPIFSREGKAAMAPEKGVLVAEVPPDSPAEAAGLLVGDVLLAYDGKPIANRKALRRRVFEVECALEDEERESDEVTITVWRHGETVAVTAPVGRLGLVTSKQTPREALGSAGAAASRSSGLEPLPGTRREVESISETVGKSPAGKTLSVTLLLGEDATKARVHALAPRARYLHLATHQIPGETARARDSRLALTIPVVPTAADDGYLRLLDLLLHWRDRISGCELVVLSACETQRGIARRDEGVFAMPWGFQYAGAPAAIASQWRVDDESTADLMSGFYARLAAGENGKLAAFNAARKALRAKYPEPYYWAPFVFIGDPR